RFEKVDIVCRRQWCLPDGASFCVSRFLHISLCILAALTKWLVLFGVGAKHANEVGRRNANAPLGSLGESSPYSFFGCVERNAVAALRCAENSANEKKSR
ncbi:MAG TPA: hypothetical protein VMA74_14350, partial [Dyella sp.]|uniref:hypothetical protein n=1 Tax=Dyella sp. TaxID=1869338 RepID=UPI002C2A19E0